MAMTEESVEDFRRETLEQVDALLAAGWYYELPEIVNFDRPSRNFSEPWQWYWRAPAKGGRKRGRRYLSTSQAFNAMCRQLGTR